MSDNQEKILVSVVLPCRNEMMALPRCLEEIAAVFAANNIHGEIIVSDSSVDRSPEIARQFGAVLIKHDEEGYGIACRKGFDAARGQYILLADADGSYDFNELPRFIKMLDDGKEFVIGNRFGGAMEPGSMPWLHRYIGNPLLSSLLRLFFGTTVTDVHCGMRAISRTTLEKISLHTSGMEFASEMIIEVVKKKISIGELPIRYRNRVGTSKLRTWADGWRHLRFMLLCSPWFLFFIPGLFLFCFGLALMAFLYFDFTSIFGIHPGYHPMFLGSTLVIGGYQLMFFSLFAKTYAMMHLGDESAAVNFLHRHITIEKASLLGGALSIIGVTIFGFIFLKWYSNSFGPLEEVKNLVVASTFFVVGIQTVFSSFMLSILGIQERR